MPSPMQLNHEHTESYGSGGSGISHAPSDGNEYVSKNGAWAVASGGGGGGGLFDALIVLKDIKAAGTVGGSGVADSWTIRDLNTEEIDTASICTLSSNQFTLVAGTYYIDGSVPLYGTRSFKSRIYNVTDTATALLGTIGISDDTGSNSNRSQLKGIITIAATKTFEVQYLADVDDGLSNQLLGNSFSSDTTEDNVFTELTIYRLA